MQFTMWFSLQCFLLAVRKENGNEPAGCFPKEVPPVPYSCPNTGKLRGTPDILKEQPEIFKTPALLLVILHVQSVLKADLFFWHNFWIWDLHSTITERLQNLCQMFHCLTFPTVAKSMCGVRREHIALRALETSPRIRHRSPSRASH